MERTRNHQRYGCYFLCRRTGARAAVSCISMGISLHICHTIGRYDSLLANSCITGFSVHIKNAESKLPRRASNISVEGCKQEKLLLFCQGDQDTVAETATDQMYKDLN